MMRYLLASVAVFAAVALVAAIWQHFRYLDLRRHRVDDRQPLLYSGSTFHAAIYVKVAVAEGRAGEMAALRAIRDAVESEGGAVVVYAGLAGMTMVESSQLPNDWSGVLMAQYPSREAFDRNRASEAMTTALDACEYTHVHGYERPVAMNLMLPIGIGAVRVRDIVTRQEPVLPFEPIPEEEAIPRLQQKRKELLQLDTYRDIREDSVVIVNLMKGGTKEEREADRAYAFEMIRGFAEGTYGPMHMGPTVPVEGESRFERFAAVYYPGIDHMHAMLGSRFMNRIVPGKQLEDTLAVATIPVLSKLD